MSATNARSAPRRIASDHGRAPRRRRSTSSAWTSARCPGAPSWCGSRRRRARQRGVRVPARVIDRPAARTARRAAAGLGPAGTRPTTVDVLRHAVPAAVAAAGIDPAEVIGIATDFTACTVLPVLADGTPLCELPESARPAARLRQALEAPRRPGPGRPDQRPRRRARRAVARPLRRQDLLRVGVRQGRCSCWRRTRSSTTAMDRWVEAADWIVWQLCGAESRNACTAGYKGIYQDGALPVRRVPGRAEPRLRRLRRASSPGTRDRRARRRAPAASPPRPPAWTGLPEGIAVAVGNVDAHVTAPAARAVEPGSMVAIMGTSTCHVMNGDVLRRGAGHVRRRSTAASSPGSGATRPARPASATSSPGSSSTASPPRYHERPRRAACASTSMLTELAAASRSAQHGLIALDWHERQPLGAGRPRAVRRDRGPDAGHPRPRRSTARCSRPPRSAPGRSSRRSTARRRAGRTSSSWPAAC